MLFRSDLAVFLSKIPVFADNQIIHTAGPEPINRFDFVARICQIFDFNRDLVVPIDKLVQKAQRPADSSLNTQKIQSKEIWTFRNISDAFLDLKQSWDTRKNLKSQLDKFYDI